MIPEDLQYSSDHEWVRTTSEGTVRIGITDYAQNSLGDIVYVQLPDLGSTVTIGDSLGEVESTKSVSDIFSPVAGTVISRNDALDSAPESVNSDPYGDGWMIEIQLDDPAELDDLLDAAGYAELVGES
ncbi:MAG: glycine cleavage system protein GcvH [Actinomycetota bacterium]|nr:glycine cleavage system protein GcvH [Actinomycetota bacterium]